MIVPGPIQTDFLSESFTDTIGEVNIKKKLSKNFYIVN